MKKVISSAYNDGKILSVHTPEITDDIQTSRQFIKSVKNVSKNFQLPTTLYNGYNLKNKDESLDNNNKGDNNTLEYIMISAFVFMIFANLFGLL